MAGDHRHPAYDWGECTAPARSPCHLPSARSPLSVTVDLDLLVLIQPQLQQAAAAGAGLLRSWEAWAGSWVKEKPGWHEESARTSAAGTGTAGQEPASPTRAAPEPTGVKGEQGSQRSSVLRPARAAGAEGSAAQTSARCRGASSPGTARPGHRPAPSTERPRTSSCAPERASKPSWRGSSAGAPARPASHTPAPRLKDAAPSSFAHSEVPAAAGAGSVLPKAEDWALHFPAAPHAALLG